MSTELYNGDSADNAIGTDGNWESNDAPDSADSAAFPAMAADTDHDIAGSDFSAVLLVNFDVELGNYMNFGTRLAELQMDTDYLNWAGSGRGFLDVDNSTEINITKTVGAASGYSYGLHLSGTGNALALIDPTSTGVVGLGHMAGTTFACTAVQCLSGTVRIGTVTTTTLYCDGATVYLDNSVTTVNANDGTTYILSGNPTTLNIKDKVYYNSTSMPTTFNLYDGGNLDFSLDGRAKAFTGTLNWFGGTITDPTGVFNTTSATVTKSLGGTWVLT